MKKDAIFFLLSSVAMYMSSCISSKTYIGNTALYQKLSSELECSNSNAIGYITTKDSSYVLTQTNNFVDSKNINSKKKAKVVSAHKNPSSKDVFLKKNAHPTEHKDSFEKKKLIVDKGNFFWKAGVILFKAGLILMSIFGGVYISVSNNGVWAYLGGLIIGLAVLALSGISFLLAIITTYVKQHSKPVDNPNEI